MSFYDITENDLNADEKLLFDANEVVEFACLNQKEVNDNLVLTTKVLTGKHSNKEYPIFLSKKDNMNAKKQRAQFLKAFWTPEEILATPSQVNPTKLVGRKFLAKAQPPREYQGNTWQNILGFKDLGNYTPGDTEAPETTTTETNEGF